MSLYRYYCGCIGLLQDEKPPLVDRALLRHSDCALDHKYESERQVKLTSSETITALYKLQRLIKDGVHFAHLRNALKD